MPTRSTPTSRHVVWRGALAVLWLTVVVGMLRARVWAADPTPTAGEKPPVGVEDAFDRGVPRTAVSGFLKACQDGDYERAAQYLDLSHVRSAVRSSQGPLLARHLKVVLDHSLLIDPDTISDDPEGDQEDGLPPSRERLGTIRQASGATVDVFLDRVKREDGVLIWKISAATVAKIRILYEEFGYGPWGDKLPARLFDITFLSIELWQWIGLGVVLLIASTAAWLFAALIEQLVRPLVTRFRADLEDRLEHMMIGPLRLAIGVTLFYAGALTLGLSLHARGVFNDMAVTLVFAALTWLSLRVVDIGSIKIGDRLSARGQFAALAMLPLGRRTVKAFLIAIALLAVLENVGFNVTGIVAGLGVGGLAVALAAQETVKNFFGGVALIADQPVRVGDFCRFGDKMGTVEDISMWSTRVRTLDRTVVSIPNGQFAALQLENFERRDRMWLHATIGLHYETTADQLRSVLEAIRALLTTHPKVQRDDARVRFVGFGPPSLQIEVSAYLQTSSLDEFLATREELFLQIMEIVSRNALHFAAL